MSGILSVAGSVLAAGALAAILARPATGVGALCLVYPFLAFVPPAPIPGLNAETVLFVAALGMTLLRVGPRIPPPVVSLPLFGYLAVLLFSWAVTATWYTNWLPPLTNLGMLAGVKRLATAALLFPIAYFLVATRRERRSLESWLAAAVGVAAALGIADAALRFSGAARELGRAAGLFGDPNVLAAFLAYFSVVPLSRAFERGAGPLARAGFLACWGSAIVASVLTLSRSGWLALAVGHAVYLAIVDRRLLAAGALAAAILGTAGYPLLPGIVRERIEETFAPSGRVYRTRLAMRLEGSAGERVVLWRVGWEMFRRRPLVGHGFNAVYIRGPQFGARYGLVQHRDAHNLYVRVLAETGLLGATLLAWLAAVVAWTALGLVRAGGEDARLGAIFLAASLAFAASNFFVTAAYQSALSVPFWALYGACARRHLELRAERAEARARAVAARAAAPVPSGPAAPAPERA